AGLSAKDMWLIYGTAVDHWDGSSWTIVDSLPINGTPTYNSIWEAANGDVWVTLSNGTVKRSQGGGPFQAMDAGCNGCFLGSIWGVATDDLFITTLPPGILHYDGNTFVKSYGGPSIAGSYQGTKDDVWVSGGDGSLLHWDGTAWTPFSTGITK